MFGIGTSEILIILLIALIILGPKEIPKIARTLGRTMREFQRVTDELKHTIDSEIEVDEEETKAKPQENPIEEKKTTDA
ncbi:MAG TPA: Sec-independent protein translocase protein TatB [Thermodesulfobacteriota bacterium]|nr:Sec-independent protein translocase protein TatB [Thermodesulfobacteriota bacterium]